MAALTGTDFAALYAEPKPHAQQKRDALVLKHALQEDAWVKWPMTQIALSVGGRAVAFIVANDYFAIGTAEDYVRVPMGAPAAQELADRLGFLLPTPRMADAIWTAASFRIEPIVASQLGVQIGAEQESGLACVKQSRAIDSVLPKSHEAGLRSGPKKDIVLTNLLLDPPVTSPVTGRRSFNRDGVAIYGFWRSIKHPDCSVLPATPGICVVQGLSTVHERTYADYSHGVRMVSPTAFVDGEARPLVEVLADPVLSKVLSHEGPLKVFRYPGVPGGAPTPGDCKGIAGPCGGALPPGVAGGGSVGGAAAVIAGIGVLALGTAVLSRRS